MDASLLCRIPPAEGEGRERDDSILDQVLDENPPDAVMPMVVPSGQVIVEPEDADGNEEDVDSVFAHGAQHVGVPSISTIALHLPRRRQRGHRLPSEQSGSSVE
jgi:hypothetical protein